MTKLCRRSLLKLPACLVPLPAVVATPIPLPIGLRHALEHAFYTHKLYLNGLVSKRTSDAVMDVFIQARLGHFKLLGLLPAAAPST